jgi:hypothetical protein
MQSTIRSKSLFFRLFICCIYVLFFAVQLHFKYSITLLTPSVETTAPATGVGKQFAKTTLQKDQHNEKTSSIRLNKRYFPGYAFTINQPEFPLNGYTTISSPHFADLTRFVASTYTETMRQRGPPSFC